MAGSKGAKAVNLGQLPGLEMILYGLIRPDGKEIFDIMAAPAATITNSRLSSTDLAALGKKIAQNPHDPLTGEDDNGSDRGAIFIQDGAAASTTEHEVSSFWLTAGQQPGPVAFAPALAQRRSSVREPLLRSRSHRSERSRI